MFLIILTALGTADAGCYGYGCGTEGVWISWGSWSTCSSSCGLGSQVRTRSCSQWGGCSGSSQVTQHCQGYGYGCGTGKCTYKGRTYSEGAQFQTAAGCNTCTCLVNGNLSCTEKYCPSGENYTQVTQTCQGINCGTCLKKRVRRNVNTLSNSKKTKLQQALQRAIDSGKYEEIGNFHGEPTTPARCSGKMCCPHGSLDFLPWHRLFMVQMEEVLGEALPYWDWTEDPHGSVPHLWKSIAAPIKQGNYTYMSNPIRCPRPNLNTVMRSSSITIHPTDLKKKTKTSFMATTFAEFHAQISAPHNDIHIGMECEMLDTRTAAYDPIFYLHHAYVDKQLAFWQELQKIRGLPLKMDPDLLKSLPPFDDLRFNNLTKTHTFNRGNETFDYEDKYCYEYDDLEFDGQTPKEFEAANPNPTPTKTPTSQNPPLPTTGQIFVNVGVILPKMAPSGFFQFYLCLADCMYAGQMATFGLPEKETEHQFTNYPFMASKKTHYLVEYEVTDLVNEQGWAGSEFELKAVLEVEARLWLKVPAPLVILRYGGGLGSIGTVVITQMREDYGDLLDKFETIIGGLEG